ncbi:MAG TPA: MFS transporter [Pseudonocardiaceae bacterium]|nr:MFS transporter [Pseudonocardiaceae bacterium]
MKTPGAGRWWALGALALSLLAVGLDLTVLNVALPTMAVSLHADTGALQWIADAYTLVLAATLLPAGKLGDRFGRKKLLVGALVVFGAASLGCAYAPDTGTLIAARAVLGLAAAFLMPLSMSVLAVLFTPAERPRAMAVWATANSIGIPLGPILGGWLLDHFWWGSVFLINVPLVAIAVVATVVLVPESRSTTRPGIDVLGVLLSGVGLLGVTFGLIEAGERGWGDLTALGMIVGGAVLIAVFVRWQRRAARPLADLGLFRSREFTWGAALTTVVTFTMFGLLFALPQYFQAVDGANALATGLRLLPMIGGLLVGVRVADRLARTTAPRTIIAIGYVAIAVGLGIGATTGAHTGYGFIATWLSVIGFGFGFAMPTAMAVAMSPLTAEGSGAGSALLMALRQVGGAVGVAVLGTVVNGGYRSHLDLAGLSGSVAGSVRASVNAGVQVARALHAPDLLASVRSAFTHGMDGTLWVSCGVAAVGVVLAIVFLPRRSATIGGHGADRDDRGVDAERTEREVIA